MPLGAIAFRHRSAHTRLPFRPGRLRRRYRFLLFLLVAALLPAGCGDNPTLARALTTCRDLHLCDRPPEPPMLIDIIGDASQGAPFNRETLTVSTERAAVFVASRPGSLLRLWVVGSTVGATRLLAEQTVPALTGKGKKSRAESTARFVDSTNAIFSAAAASVFKQKPALRSPLVEAVAKVGLADSFGMSRVTILITDGREVSNATADFECERRLPSVDAWRELLEKRRLLPAGALKDMTVMFSYVTASPSGRCRVELSREVQVRELWTAALAGLGGAKAVSFASGPATLGDGPSLALAGGY